MSRMMLAIAIAAACGPTEPPEQPEPEYPSPTPPPSWGAPLTGGTMIVTRDDRRAVIADPDRDRIAIVDLVSHVAVDIALSAGDQPGRLIEDGAGRIHVALRGGGALVTLPDPASGAGPVRRAACSEPRGVAYDAATDRVHVACASGELVSFGASGGEAIRRLRLETDLRDVLVSGTGLIVTRFRAAEVLTLDAAGAVVRRVTPPRVKRQPPRVSFELPPPEPVDAVPAVAWRTIAMPDGRLLIAHQRQLDAKLRASQGGYVSTCPEATPVESAITVIAPDAAPLATDSFVRGALPIDIATSPRGDTVAAVAAASERVIVASAVVLSTPDRGECVEGFGEGIDDQIGAPTSIAFTAAGALVIYYPEVPALVIHETPGAIGGATATVALPGTLGYDSGRALFHVEAPAKMACASCHPEGREDGLVWEVEDTGPRRTQTLAGHILLRAPYHWSADIANLGALTSEVFTGRMGGREITSSELRSLGPWLERIPAPRWAVSDPEAAARGKALFDSDALACRGCHAGALFTVNAAVDAGTGGSFKVPSLLGVAARAPYMHDGCAATLADCLSSCGGSSHAIASTLPAAQQADLVAYLESL